MRRLGIILAYLPLVVLAVLGWTAGPSKASEPYGGCKEGWQAPHSQGARECRAHGWIIRPRVVVNPDGTLEMSALPRCTGPRDLNCGVNLRQTTRDHVGRIVLDTRHGREVRLVFVPRCY